MSEEGQSIKDKVSSGELPGVFELWGGNQLYLTRRVLLDRQLAAIPEAEEVKATPVAEIGDKDFNDGFPDTGMLPTMETLITGLPGG